MADNWRVVRELARDLTEAEARKMLETLDDKTYAENPAHDYIEYADAPITIGRQQPEL